METIRCYANPGFLQLCFPAWSLISLDLLRLHCVYLNCRSLLFELSRVAESGAEVGHVSASLKSGLLDAFLMHHEISNSTGEERQVQKNIKIQYLKGAQGFI